MGPAGLAARLEAQIAAAVRSQVETRVSETSSATAPRTSSANHASQPETVNSVPQGRESRRASRTAPADSALPPRVASEDVWALLRVPAVPDVPSFVAPLPQPRSSGSGPGSDVAIRPHVRDAVSSLLRGHAERCAAEEAQRRHHALIYGRSWAKTGPLAAGGGDDAAAPATRDYPRPWLLNTAMMGPAAPVHSPRSPPPPRGDVGGASTGTSSSSRARAALGSCVEAPGASAFLRRCAAARAAREERHRASESRMWLNGRDLGKGQDAPPPPAWDDSTFNPTPAKPGTPRAGRAPASTRGRRYSLLDVAAAAHSPFAPDVTPLSLRTAASRGPGEMCALLSGHVARRVSGSEAGEGGSESGEGASLSPPRLHTAERDRRRRRRQQGGEEGGGPWAHEVNSLRHEVALRLAGQSQHPLASAATADGEASAHSHHDDDGDDGGGGGGDSSSDDGTGRGGGGSGDDCSSVASGLSQSKLRRYRQLRQHSNDTPPPPRRRPAAAAGRQREGALAWVARGHQEPPADGFTYPAPPAPAPTPRRRGARSRASSEDAASERSAPSARDAVISHAGQLQGEEEAVEWDGTSLSDLAGLSDA